MLPTGSIIWTTSSAFPDVGQTIRNKIPFVLIKPTINDLFEDTNVRMYNLQADDPTVLTDSSLANFLKAHATFKKDDKDRRDKEAKVCHLILSSLSEEARMHLRSVPAFKKAVDECYVYDSQRRAFKILQLRRSSEHLPTTP
jgi:hypothetical protein